ncbi:MAG: ABC transporter substrate-binding protein [Alphaproteobacteria bacterium]|nr:ABC transporter substrate-binding protein [Alphaproteobacteria bacterium]
MTTRLSLFLLALLWVLPASAEKHLRFAMWGFPAEGGNPYAATALPAILSIPAFYDGLTHIAYSGNVEPRLATSWHREDELTWFFELRPDVKFANGERFDAAAVIAMFEYLLSAEGQTTAVGREVAAVARAEARGPLTVALITKTPRPLLPREIATARIPAPGWWATVNRAGPVRDAVGTGPFTVSAWTDNRIEFAANRASWRAPRLDRMTMLLLPDQNSRLQALLSGAADIATSIGPDDRPTIEAAGGQFVASLWAGVTSIIFVSTKPGPVADARVRRALNFAVNKERIVDALMGGMTVVASQPVPPGAIGYNPDLKPYPYDPDRARQLLAEAGYPDGFDLVIEMPLGIGNNADAWHAQIAADLLAVGVRMTLRPISMSTSIQKVYGGGWEGDGYTAAFNTLPSLDGLRVVRQHSCLWQNPWYCNPADMPLIEAALVESDPDRLDATLRQLFTRYHEDAPGLFLFQLPGYVALGPRVRNFATDYGIYNFDAIDLVDEP